MGRRLCLVLTICTFFIVSIAKSANAQCDTACAANYQPVCGRARQSSTFSQYEFRTFSNECQLDAENCRSNGNKFWEFYTSGQCTGQTATSRPDRSCDTSCATNYSPVCGRNRNGELRTFSNRCKFTAERCKNPSWTYERDGQCSANSQLPTPFPTTELISCNSFCQADYRPVCGRNGNEFKTFPNRCMFNNEKCKFSAWIFVRDGQCTTQQQNSCNTFCQADYRPVCGRQGNEMRTFPNRCSFTNEQCRTASWTFVRDGQCPLQSNCNTFCQADYRPVCGIQGTEMKTFPNRCSLTNEQCRSPSWKFVREGQCLSSSALQACNSYCPVDNRPVCGRSATEMKTFPNRCSLRNEQCKFPEWKFVREGQCLSTYTTPEPSQCNTYCPADYRPVCGRSQTEQKTFPNRCSLANEQCRSPDWKFVREGQCLSTYTTPEPPQCDTYCPADYRPVCGRSSTEMKTFPNRCSLTNEQCKSPDWTFVREGQCYSTYTTPEPKNCDAFCIADYRPVCGRIGNEMKTFPNRCSFTNEQCKSPDWKFVREGQCISVTTSVVPQCNSFCPADFRPVCGRSGNEFKTFPNRCNFNNEKCKLSTWTFVRDGQCSAFTTTTPEPETCNTFCTEHYDPVCGKNGNDFRTFSNQCKLNLAQCTNPEWRLIDTGICNANSKTKACNTFCGFEYAPVCGRSGFTERTFTNRCQFEKEQCNSPALKYAHAGSCS